MQVIRQRALARSALVGNPSDGYGGRTLAFTFQQFAATVVLYPWESLEILPGIEDRNQFRSLDELVDDVRHNGYYGGARLVKATIKRFAEYCRFAGRPLHDAPFSIRYESDIPRGVGLAGSSAIVVATLKCLMAYYDVEIPRRVQPSLARETENDELDIACGWQDRVVQVYEGLVAMDFSSMETVEGYWCGDYRRLDASLLPPLYIAYDTASRKPSSRVHGPLRDRMQSNEELSGKMDQIAQLAPEAIAAIQGRDDAELNRLIDRNFDLRASLYQISDAHRELVMTARGVGASAQFAGSGGAIVGSFRDDDMFAALRAALHARNPDWQLFRPHIESTQAAT
jgi:glucuronokinase